VSKEKYLDMAAILNVEAAAIDMILLKDAEWAVLIRGSTFSEQIFQARAWAGIPAERTIWNLRANKTAG